MCGLVGIIPFGHTQATTTVARTHAIMFKELLFADELRGPHSTGIFMGDSRVKRGSACPLIKRATPASEFLYTPEVYKYLKRHEDFGFIMGHNRWATSGEVLHKTAHPFKCGDITLMHNGTLRSVDGLESLTDNKLHEVDSARLTATVASTAEDKYVEMLERINGAFALVWYNAKSNKLFMARNSERPLHVVENYAGAFFASDKNMLEWIYNRNYKSSPNEVKQIPSGELWAFDLSSDTRTSIEKTAQSYKFTPHKTTYASYYSAGWNHDYGGFDYEASTYQPGTTVKYKPHVSGAKTIAVFDKDRLTPMCRQILNEFGITGVRINFIPTAFKGQQYQTQVGQLHGQLHYLNKAATIVCYGVNKQRAEVLLHSAWLNARVRSAYIEKNIRHIVVESNSLRITEGGLDASCVWCQTTMKEKPDMVLGKVFSTKPNDSTIEYICDDCEDEIEVTHGVSARTIM